MYVISLKDAVDEILETSGSESFEAQNIMIVGGSRIGKHIAYYIAAIMFGQAN